MIFRYTGNGSDATGNGSIAGFSNYFRYKLLYDKGGYWVDTDTICLKKFDFPEEYVFMSTNDNGIRTNVGLIKAPAGSNILKYLFDVCMSKDPKKLRWGETGPNLFNEAVKKYDLEKYVKHMIYFTHLII